MSAASSYLLKFQIGPVQEFIVQARSTRDLWSGSYLLSWLVAAGIRELPGNATLIFPSRSGQPLLKEPLNHSEESILTPNLPNIFIAEVPGDARKAAGEIENRIRIVWREIAEAVWEQRNEFGLDSTLHERFFAQVDRHLSIAWQVTTLPTDEERDYRQAYKLNGLHLDAVRQFRDFAAWRTISGPAERDSLSGKEESLVGGDQFRDAREKAGGEYSSLFAKHTDHLGAIAIIKRCWHRAYLAKHHGLPTSSEEHRIRSIPAIASRKDTHDDKAPPQETFRGERYIAAIAFDGDLIGKWVNGDFLDAGANLRKHHESFSEALSLFALNEVPQIIAPKDRLLGQLIYAGGDDVAALVPADEALVIAEKLRTAFLKSTASTCSADDQRRPDASAGIAIAHVKSPLQDLIREALKAEKRAKTDVGRPAFSVTLIKRSGEISEWGCKWSLPGGSGRSAGLDLYEKIDDALVEGALSGRFPHRICELLTPYLTHRTGLAQPTDAIDDPNVIKDLIRREFVHAALRQGSEAKAAELAGMLTRYLDEVIAARKQRIQESKREPKHSLIQELLTSVIGLCTTVAFADRNRLNPKSAATPAAP